MTGRDLRVVAGESGHVRLFTIDTEHPDGAALRAALVADDGTAPALVAAALGVGHVDPQWITLVPVADVRAIGLATYLRAGHDIPDEQLAAQSAALGRAAGHILLVMSPAFAGRAETIALSPCLTPLAAFTRRREAPPAPPPQPDPVPAPPAPEPAPVRGGLRPLAIGALVVAAALIVLLLALGGGS
ncbi:hypothetical protein ACVDG3_02940 [Meridianimarinicoccus sp. RP-17]|uniref:hypothetical protein n=1 Tax=Meridianimarinicoccus zhengii TaxID=2056810 RepID=UPI000DAECE14|nr:hypothetical protein [Phycocomes zhengii]